MKKFFAIAAVAMMALSASAQVYVGGSLGYNSEKENKDAEAVNTFSINPEIGYELSEGQEVGVELLYKNVSDQYTSYGLGVYYRQSLYQNGNFSLFVEPSVAYVARKNEGADETGSVFGVAVAPGIKYNLNDKFAVVAKIGGLSYTKNSDNIGGGSTFKLGVNGNSLSLGLLFNL